MTDRLRFFDRFATLLTGVGLLTLGLLAYDWRFEVVGGYPSDLSLEAVRDLADTGWWPWAITAVTVPLALAALAWLLLHLRRPGPGTLRLSASDSTGRIQGDLRSVATAAAASLQERGPLASVRGSTRSQGRRTIVELRAALADGPTDTPSLLRAATQTAAEVHEAFPQDHVVCRVLIDGPRRRRLRGARHVRVQQ